MRPTSQHAEFLGLPRPKLNLVVVASFEAVRRDCAQPKEGEANKIRTGGYLPVQNWAASTFVDLKAACRERKRALDEMVWADCCWRRLGVMKRHFYCHCHVSQRADDDDIFGDLASIDYVFIVPVFRSRWVDASVLNVELVVVGKELD
jgi:hypothetical protein